MAVLLLVLLVLAISYASSLKAWLQQRDALAAAHARIDASTEAIAELEKQKARYDDPEFVEQQARSRFGWVMPGEVGFTVLGADGEPVGDAPELTAPTSTEDEGGPVWWNRLWSSVETAGDVPGTEDAPTTTSGSGGVVKPQDHEE
ncbi:septum formation initiator [Mumia flava]|uniref:Septum formation initiator n=1 Tax=Mumia flava TaxID=1348852 RepID=A0A2M9BFX2_9ACTN|nr:septum formation initiator family protein [Mumia flava]PJJ56845.1 septum formation initiator [Mumia flava]